MNIFDIIKNLYTNPSSSWINELDESNIQPVVIQRFLVLDNKTLPKIRILNKFVFTLPAKMYLSAVWSVLFFNGKKLSKTPFLSYPKRKESKDRYYFIFDKLKDEFKLADKDFEVNKKFINDAIESNKVKWFSYYGVKKQHWFNHNIDFEQIKDFKKRPKFDVNKTLDAYF